MGWMTNKNKSWELRQLGWTLFSVLMIIPIPIHVFPFVMMAQAQKAKVRSWYVSGILFLIAQLGLLGAFIYFAGALTPQLLWTTGGFLLTYLGGNALLLSRSRFYLQRLELETVRPLQWIRSVGAEQKRKSQMIELHNGDFFVQRLLNLRERINNGAIKKNVTRIIDLFQLVERKDAFEAEKFLVRHSTVVNVLSQYADLQNSNIYNDTTKASKANLEAVISKAVSAIEQEVTNLFRSNILEVSAETDAYLQSLKNRNLLKEG